MIIIIWCEKCAVPGPDPGLLLGQMAKPCNILTSQHTQLHPSWSLNQPEIKCYHELLAHRMPQLWACARDTKYLYRPLARLFTGSPGNPKIFVGMVQNKYLVDIRNNNLSDPFLFLLFEWHRDVDMRSRNQDQKIIISSQIIHFTFLKMVSTDNVSFRKFQSLWEGKEFWFGWIKIEIQKILLLSMLF